MAPLQLQDIEALRAPRPQKAGAGAGYDSWLRRIVESLDSKDEKDLAVNAGPDILDSLSPQLDTLPYLYILSSRIAVLSRTVTSKSSLPDSLRPGQPLWTKLGIILTTLDPVEARYGGRTWRNLVATMGKTAKHAPSEQLAEAAVSCMAAAILRMDSSAGTLTTSHLELVDAALSTKSNGSAVSVLDKDIHSLPGKATAPGDGGFLCSPHYMSNAYITLDSNLTDSLSLQSVSEYFTSAAMVYIGLRQWPRALSYLEHVLCLPTNNTATAAMVEAYKKWVLVNLLVHGHLASTHPKSANGPAMKTARLASKEYEAVAEAFRLMDSKKLLADAYEAQDEFRNSGNLGLMRKVIDHQRQLRVSNLQRTYTVVPVNMVATNFGLSTADTATYLQELIQNGSLLAHIEQGNNGGDAVLRFNDDTGSKLSVDEEIHLRRDLLEQTHRLKQLVDHMTEADQRLSMSKEYVEWERRARKTKKDGIEAAAEEPMDLGVDQLSDDENVMADVG